MTISIWRYSHLLLAIVASLFLIVASLTGVILAIEPISNQAKGHDVVQLDEVSLATTVTALTNNFDEVFSLEVTPANFVKASVLTKDFETKDLYINASTGETLAEVAERPSIYSFATNLHRSLFLKSIGRFFVGLVSLLLVLITCSGIVLLVKRQGGIKRFFSKVQKDYFEMRFHVVLSRWLFIPIIIVAATGVFLSAEKFNLLPDTALQFEEQPKNSAAIAYATHTEIPLFQKTKLSEVRSVTFPFSKEPEEYFQIALKDKEIKVHQHTGAIISSASYPFVVLTSRLSFALHTGEGSILWSIILCIASASILFFMYSGFVMTLKRIRKTKPSTTMTDKDACEYIILVGSETGTTYGFAQQFCDALTLAGKSVFITELNSYTVFKNATHIFVFTATYGEGEATTNARKFESIFPTIQQPNPIKYTVVGFGSLEYPDYCQFAIKVDGLLQGQEGFSPLLPLYKINNASEVAFRDWVKNWSIATTTPVQLKVSESKKKRLSFKDFEVIERTSTNLDETFLLKLKPLKRTTFSSGDLLAILPENSEAARQYSIAKVDKAVLLSIKKHEKGQVSPYLYSLEKGELLRAAITVNRRFHLRKKTPAILIGNGTGIAPFLGMIQENRTSEINLFWGGRTMASSNIYSSIISKELSANKNLKVHACYSREGKKQYVQDLIAVNKELLLATIEKQGVLMICGSLAMQNDVLNTLDVLLKSSKYSLDELQHREQLFMDCY
ncbi:oxidoreductase [Rasiella rasia]|uniref:Oxidoreductase n=1 Tax=Rasiella rasia TaxID=2744027 RepID=A0A6G6GK44_9FLAO|nr:PepSY domain-containing protein [Rasiella rasia]QIE58918.1 oxidoreductase [Rasiella rasia]